MHTDKNAIYAGFNYPPINITMPVFNRHETTLRCIEALNACTQTPYTLTVVDNGSKPELRKELVKLHKKQRIHHLYLLDQNYGVSCACNTGWQMHSAPFYMKLDNDICVLNNTWLQDIFIMWGKNRYNTIFGPVWNGTASQCKHETAFGTYWELPLSMSGQAFIISKKIFDAIGYFSEDYGIYGEEDADYCLRCHQVGIRKYSYEARDMLLDDGFDPTDYLEQDIAKRSIHEHNVGTAEKKGLFALNLFLYEHGLRSLNVPRKYTVAGMSGYDVRIQEQPDYAPWYARLMECLDIFNDPTLGAEEQLVRIKKVLQ